MLEQSLQAIEKTFVIANSSAYDSFVAAVVVLPWETYPFCLDAFFLEEKFFFAWKVFRLIYFNCQKLLLDTYFHKISIIRDFYRDVLNNCQEWERVWFSVGMQVSTNAYFLLFLYLSCWIVFDELIVNSSIART